MKNLALLAAAVAGVALVLYFINPACVNPNKTQEPIEPAVFASEPLRVGVVAFKNNSGAYAPGWDFGANIATTITTGLGGRSDFRIFERQQTRKVIEEWNLNPLQNPKTAVKIGNLTGVQFLIIGKITRASQQEVPTPWATATGTMVTIDFKAVDSETGKIKVVDTATGCAIGGSLKKSGLHIPTVKEAVRKAGKNAAVKLSKYVEVR